MTLHRNLIIIVVISGAFVTSVSNVPVFVCPISIYKAHNYSSSNTTEEAGTYLSSM